MDTTPLDGITEALRALAGAGGDRPASALTPGELMAVGRAFGALKRHVDAAFAPVAAEIARQSRRELGGESLAKKQGFASPAILISTATGTSVGEAVRIVQVGEATAPRASLEPRHDQLHADRSLLLQERDGMLVLTGKLDPETGAPIKACTGRPGRGRAAPQRTRRPRRP